MVYDADVYLTEDASDTPDQCSCGPLSTIGPIHGPYATMGSPTFSRLNQIAVECGGGWEDWEPCRCTYSFKKKKQIIFFMRIAYHEFRNAISIEKRIYDEND